VEPADENVKKERAVVDNRLASSSYDNNEAAGSGRGQDDDDADSDTQQDDLFSGHDEFDEDVRTGGSSGRKRKGTHYARDYAAAGLELCGFLNWKSGNDFCLMQYGLEQGCWLPEYCSMSSIVFFSSVEVCGVMNLTSTTHVFLLF